MQTSLARRQRHRRREGRRPRGSGAGRVAAVVLPLFLFATLLGVGLVGFTGTVAAYSYFSRDLPDPREKLEEITFTQQSTVVDRSGQVVLARLGDDRRDVVLFEDIPPMLIDATTSIEDRTFWDNTGFDPLGFLSATIDTLQGRERGGSTITQQLVRSRLLPESAFEGSIYERKAKEIIQSIRLTEAYPGEEGKQSIMEKYLNNNFYGNRSYGIAAAAKSYFGKTLDELTLAEAALLAGIPQSPTRFDLVRNAVEQAYTDENGQERTRLVVPATAEIVQRRNYILDRMALTSVLTAGEYTDADFAAAKREPVVLASQAPEQWRAPHFVWQVRRALGTILCGTESADQCRAIDTGGYRVTTSLDWSMQQTIEKWVFVAARAPNARDTEAILEGRGIPRSEWPWIVGLRGHNIHNAAGAVVDYRTGEVLAWAGSASYTAAGNEKFQPQFDVLADGWRQPGSSIKPINYLIGIEDRTMTAATMFMDVVTNFAPQGQAAWTPTQADKLERGPVRLRSALQFSLNVPAIKAGLINGPAHQLERTREFGLAYPRNTIPVVSQSIGTLETHPIDLIQAYGAIANGGVLMPERMILEIRDADGNVVWPVSAALPTGTRVASEGAAYIVTDILRGNTNSRVNPFWAKWAPTDGFGRDATFRPAAYKTGTTSDNRDVHAYGYLAPPSDPDLPGLVVGVWMGNSNNEPNDGKLSLDTSAPLWRAILSEVSRGMPIEDFERVRPDGLVEARVDAFTGMLPSGSTTRTVTELFLPGTVPNRPSDLYTVVDIDAASGLLWQDGCVGPMQPRTYIDFGRAEPAFPAWTSFTLGWQARAADGRRAGGPERTRPQYFYGSGFFPFGQSWGGAFAPTEVCPAAPPEPTPCIPTDGVECPTPPPGNGNGNGNGNGPPGGRPTPTPSPTPTSGLIPIPIPGPRRPRGHPRS